MLRALESPISCKMFEASALGMQNVRSDSTQTCEIHEAFVFGMQNHRSDLTQACEIHEAIVQNSKADAKS